jgi:prepilin-type N-terminal cleavage/methylation domain-containing protein
MSATNINIKKKLGGFSLVEISIVLIIIGLLVAGIMGGKSLVQSSKNNQLLIEIRSFKQAILSFYTTYQEYPGDFSKAYDNFGTQCDSVAQSCNGNGNGNIEISNGEHFRANQHLSLAKLWRGSYNGIDEHIISSYDENMYFPPSKCPEGYNDLGENCHLLGGASDTNKAGITPLTMYKIDKKIDDALPKTGYIRFYETSYVTEETCGSTDYLLNQDRLGCNLIYSIDVTQY